MAKLVKMVTLCCGAESTRHKTVSAQRCMKCNGSAVMCYDTARDQVLADREAAAAAAAAPAAPAPDPTMVALLESIKKAGN